MTLSGQSNYIWAPTTGASSGLQKSGVNSTDRLAATWYTGSTESFDVKISDGNIHQVALYALDWDHGGSRSERIDIIDDATGTVLSSQTITGFQNGEYLVWNLGGNVTIRVTNTNTSGGGNNAVVSGLFFDKAH